MVHELLTAIYTRFTGTNGNTLGALLGARNNLFANIAPDDTVTPYITYFVVTDSTNDTFASDILEPLVQFSVWDDQASLLMAWQVAAALRTLYKDQLLTLATWRTIRAQVASVGPGLWSDTDARGQVVMDVQYVIGL